MASVAVKRVGQLPAEVTSFVGRNWEVSQTRGLLETARLVTLTGMGGVGKTRLALRVAADVGRVFPDGVWLAELAAVGEPDLLAQTVVDALGLHDQSLRDPVDVLVSHVAERALLLVLDTCEHLVDACAMLAEVLLRAAPQLRILATSRQPLDVQGEHLLVVAPLRFPGEGQAAEPGHDAVTLFADRAMAVQPDFSVTDLNRDHVARLCDRLEGIPLAIELAAARLRAMSVEQLVDRLGDRFQVTRARRTSQPRHQTLHAAVGWSHELCTPDERLLWARLSVFAADFDLEAVESICADEEIPADVVFELVTMLVEKSVVTYQGTGRYGMLDTLREYGAEQLEQRAETVTLRKRHLDHYLRLAMRAESVLTTSAQAEWFVRLNLEQADLRAALDHAIAEGQADAALRMVSSLGTIWIARGLLREARHWFSRALAVDGGAGPTRVRTLYLDAVATLLQGSTQDALRQLALARELAKRCDLAALDYITEIEGMAAYVAGDLDRCRELLECSAVAHRRAGHRDALVPLNEVFLAGVLAFTGDLQRALAVSDAVVRECEAMGELWCRSHALCTRGFVQLLQGNNAEAEADGREAIRIARRLDDRLSLMSGLDLLASYAKVSGDPKRAARLIGGSDWMWQQHGASPFGAPMVARRDKMKTRLRAMLGNEMIDAIYASGARLAAAGAEELTADALGEPSPAASSARPSARSSGVTPLTRREREIAGLVAEGLSNRDIANRLVIAKRTVDSHLEHILAKLGFTSRTQIATWVTERSRNSSEDG